MVLVAVTLSIVTLGLFIFYIIELFSSFLPPAISAFGWLVALLSYLFTILALIFLLFSDSEFLSIKDSLIFFVWPIGASLLSFAALVSV